MESLTELAGSLSAKPVLFPTQDLHQFLLCRNRRSLEDKVIFSFMDCGAGLDCLDKRRTYPGPIEGWGRCHSFGRAALRMAPRDMRRSHYRE